MDIEGLAARSHARDVERACELIGDAIRRAGELWLPGDAIAEALARNLTGFTGHHGNSGRLARRLRDLADAIEQAPRHRLC